MGEPLDYVIDDFMTGGHHASDHHMTQARHVAGRSAQKGKRATGMRRGVRGVDFNSPELRERRRREAQVDEKQRTEFASYLDTKRRHDALVRGGKVEGNTITFDNRETRLAYQNNRGIMNSYEDKQFNCDNGNATACEAVGRSVGDGLNPLQRGNEGLLFGFAGGSGRTRDYNVNSVSGVDGVPSGGGMIRRRPLAVEGGGGGGGGEETIPPAGGGAPRDDDVVVGVPVMPETGGIFRPKRQRPRVENASGGDRDGRDGTASVVGVQTHEELNTGRDIDGAVDAPLVEKGQMINRINQFESLRIQKNIVRCPKDNQLVIHHA